MKSPLKIGALVAPKNRLLAKAGRIDTGQARRVAGLSAAGAVVLGVATGSALFVDYLAERARAGEAAIALKPVVTKSVDPSPEAVVASAAPVLAKAVPSQPAPAEPELVPSQLQPEPIQARLPDAAAVARVAVGAEHAVELPADDPEADPVLAYADENGVEEDQTMTGAISPDEAAPEPVRKPRKKAAETKPAAKENTEIASLPGVNVGGLAGHPSEDDDNSDSKVRTVVKASGGTVTGTAQVKSPVNMRSAPKKGASVLGVVPAGTSVKVMSCDGWCQISWNGRSGWVYKSFLSATKKPAPTAEKQQGRKVQSSRS